MILRDATLADASELARLGRDSFVAKFGHLYRREDLEGFLASTFSIDAVSREIEDDGLLHQLAEDERGLIGYCKVGFTSHYAEHAEGRRPMDLKQLYTDPALTGQGIGKPLMDWALATLREHGADEILLTVYSENFGAQRFYQRYGFTKRADIYFMVGEHRDDEFLYALRL